MGLWLVLRMLLMGCRLDSSPVWGLVLRWMKRLCLQLRLKLWMVWK